MLSSPLYFYLVGYGHPFHLGFLLLLLSWIALLEAFRRRDTARGRMLLAGAVVLGAVALMIRFEQVALTAVLLIGLLAARAPDAVSA